MRGSLTRPQPEAWRADVVVMLGLLGFRQPDVDQASYARYLLRRAWDLCTGILACDFLSAERSPDYPEEDWVYYYDPAEVLRWGLELSPRVRLRHDYPPIPQREMLLLIQRDD